MSRLLLFPSILLTLAGCTDILATAYKPVEREIVGIVTEKKDPPAPATPPADPAAPAPAR